MSYPQFDDISLFQSLTKGINSDPVASWEMFKFMDPITTWLLHNQLRGLLLKPD